jgi:hypothetical protein
MREEDLMDDFEGAIIIVALNNSVRGEEFPADQSRAFMVVPKTVIT